MFQKFDSKLIRCLGTCFSKDICQLINVRINYFVFIILNFLFFTNFFANFYEFFTVIFSKKFQKRN